MSHYFTRIDPPLPMNTPKGPAMAHGVIDYGQEHHLVWVCFQEQTGECWSWPNHQVRMGNNVTMWRGGTDKPEPMPGYNAPAPSKG